MLLGFLLLQTNNNMSLAGDGGREESGPACCRGPAGGVITKTRSSQNEGQRLFLPASPGERGAGPAAVGARQQCAAVRCHVGDGSAAQPGPSLSPYSSPLLPASPGPANPLEPGNKLQQNIRWIELPEQIEDWQKY